MGRRRLIDRPKEWKLSLPSSLTDEVEARLTDPLTGAVKYGARTKLIERLLRDWLEGGSNEH